jgi:hypothetical protein
MILLSGPRSVQIPSFLARASTASARPPIGDCGELRNRVGGLRATVPEVLDDRVAPGKEDTLVAGVLPADAERRTAALAEDLEDLGVPLRLAHVVSTDDQAVTRCRSREGR